MLNYPHGPTQGAFLTELMVGIAVGMIILAGAMTVYTGSLKTSSDNLLLALLNQNLRAIMDIMVRDIRRAGYVSSDPEQQFLFIANNPFSNLSLLRAGTGISVGNGASATCLLYAYNKNWAAGAMPAINSNEQLGFALYAGNVRMKKSGHSATATDTDCSNVGNGSYWESLNDPSIRVTDLSFIQNESPLNISAMLDGTGDANGNGKCDSGEACNTCIRDGAPDPGCLYVRDITIRLGGSLASDSSVAQTITENVRIRNDKYLPAL